MLSSPMPSSVGDTMSAFSGPAEVLALQSPALGRFLTLSYVCYLLPNLETLDHRNDVLSHTVPVGQEYRSRLGGCLCPRVSHEVTLKMSLGLWSPEAWRTWFLCESLTWLARCCWLVVGASALLHAEFSTWLLECPQRWLPGV